MFAFSSWWRAMAMSIALAGGASAAPALTTIQDILYKADGTRFNGTLSIAWRNFQAADDSTIPTQGISVTVINGALKVRLVPTTNASEGASYAVTYLSQGKYQFSETWAVPSSTSPLRVRDVRVSSGSVVGPQPVTTEVAISDVTGLANELAMRPMRGAGFTPSRTAIINSSGQIEAAAGNLDDCIHVDGSSGTCGSGASDAGVAYADAETPTGLVNGVNTGFNLNYAPAPVGSLAFYRNGVLMKQGYDYTLSGNTVTFYAAAVPQAGDLLTASYRYSSQVQQGNVGYSDAETPLGPVNGSNRAFTLNYAPAPAGSLALYRNGVLAKQGADYALSGNTITFYASSTPQAGDLLTVFYRYAL